MINKMPLQAWAPGHGPKPTLLDPQKGLLPFP